MFPLVSEDVFKQQFAKFAFFGTGRNLRVLNLATDIAFLVGEEEVEVAVACNERFGFQTIKRGFYVFPVPLANRCSKGVSESLKARVSSGT